MIIRKITPEQLAAEIRVELLELDAEQEFDGWIAEELGDDDDET